jgi:hypothetical protein
MPSNGRPLEEEEKMFMQPLCKLHISNVRRQVTSVCLYFSYNATIQILMKVGTRQKEKLPDKLKF